MGLVRVDGSAKPSYHAYGFMTKTVGERRVAAWTYAADGTRVYRFSGDPPVWIAWNALRPGKATVETGDVRAFPCSIYGVKLTTLPVSGEVGLDVGHEPVFLVPTK